MENIGGGHVWGPLLCLKGPSDNLTDLIFSGSLNLILFVSQSLMSSTLIIADKVMRKT